MAKITLENGVEFEGTAEELRDMFEKFGVKFDEGSAEGERTVRAREDFSVGDRVKLDVVEGNTPRYGWGGVKNGEIGTVSGIDGSIIRVDFPRHRSWNAAPSELVILEKAEEADVEVPKQAQELTEGFVKVNAPAQVGDYVKVTKSRHVDITVGKFYEVIKVYEGGGVRVKDDVGDDHDSGFRPNYEFEVYRKFEFIEGAPQVGDKVLITNAYITGGEYEDGDILTVEKHQPDTFEYVEHITVEGIAEQINRDEFEIIERAVEATAPKLKVGDYAKVKDGAYVMDLSEGDIVKIVSTAGLHDFHVVRVSDGETEPFNKEDLVEATEKEIAKAKAPKVGTYAKVTGSECYHGFEIGDVVQRVEGFGLSHGNPKFKRLSDGKTQYLKAYDFETITDEEARVALRPKLHEGDLVRILEDENGAKVGEIVEISEADTHVVQYYHIDAAPMTFVAKPRNVELVAKASDRVDG